jgi:hypothetical protein
MLIHFRLLSRVLLLMAIVGAPVYSVDQADDQGEKLDPRAAAALRDEIIAASATKARRSFVVLVVDQDDRPIAGIPLHCSSRSTKASLLRALSLGVLPDGDAYDREEWVQETDANGMVTTKVIAFDHRFGIRFDQKAMPREIAPVNGHHALSLSPADANALKLSAHPLVPTGVDAIFRVTRRPMPEPLAQMGSWVRVATNGEAYAWSVFGLNRKTEPMKLAASLDNGLGEFDFVLNVVRDQNYPFLEVDKDFNSTGPHNYTSFWSYRLQATSGGLQVRDKSGVFIAPEDGYQPVIERTFVPDTEGYRSRDEIRLWWRMDRQPVIFGMVHLTIEPSQFGNYAEPQGS